jgi:Flp pilus assembly protein TadG
MSKFKLWSDRNGAAAVELAMTAPFIIALIAGAVEYGRGFALQVDLEQAAQRAAELARERPPTANANTTTTGWAHVRAEAETAAGYPANSSNVTVELYRDCSLIAAPYTTTRATPYGTNCATTHRAADFIRVEVRGTYTRLINFRSILGSEDSAVSVTRGQATVRLR